MGSPPVPGRPNSSLEALAARTARMYAKAREAGAVCRCACGCQYMLPSKLSQAKGECFGCRHGVHFGGTALILEAE